MALGWIAQRVDSWEPPEEDVGIYLFDCDLEENYRPIIIKTPTFDIPRKAKKEIKCPTMRTQFTL